MKTKEFYIYILETECGKYYCGITDDLQKRYRKHKSGKGAKFTRSFKPKRMCAAWKTEYRKNALKVELMIKKLTRVQKKQLIENTSQIKNLPGSDMENLGLETIELNETDFI